MTILVINNFLFYKLNENFYCNIFNNVIFFNVTYGVPTCVDMYLSCCSSLPPH